MNCGVQAAPGRRYIGLVETLGIPGATQVDARIKAVPVVGGRRRCLVGWSRRQVGAGGGSRCCQRKGGTEQARSRENRPAGGKRLVRRLFFAFVHRLSPPSPVVSWFPSPATPPAPAT